MVRSDRAVIDVFGEGGDAAEAIAASLGAPLEKRDPPLLSTPGYESAVRSLLRAISRATSGADRAAVQELARKLDRDWPTMPKGERERVIASAAKSLLGVPELVIGKVQKSIIAQATEIVRIAKRDTGRTFRLSINPTFNAKDEKIIRAAAESQGNYITDRYRDRAEAVSKRARAIVSDGLEKGLGRQDIGAAMRAQLLGPTLRASEAYWQTVASVHIGRARSIGQIGGFEDAGIDTFEFDAVLDSETTDICRFMHGKRFSVAKARATFNVVEASDDPKGIEKLQPWVRSGKTEDGAQVLFIDRGGGRRSIVADVHESGVGTSDKIGKYSSPHDSDGLQKMGIGTPPLHCRCRSTIAPA